MSVDQSAGLATLVAERPSRAQLFERLHLDYCCGGSQTLAEACGRRGLDTNTVCELLEALDEGRLPAEPREERDWREAGIGELCDHIVSAHHEGLRGELPRVSELLATVVRVHGGDRPELEEVSRRFARISGDLEHHLEIEEQALFPACRSLEANRAAGAVDEELIDRHEADHSGLGEELVELRELAGGYDTSQALCSTHRALLEALRHFEADLHRHIHEENNVLFPRVRELAGVGAQSSGLGGDRHGQA
jgi:regulator of cell morphogenesis and NO signaling